MDDQARDPDDPGHDLAPVISALSTCAAHHQRAGWYGRGVGKLVAAFADAPPVTARHLELVDRHAGREHDFVRLSQSPVKERLLAILLDPLGEPEASADEQRESVRHQVARIAEAVAGRATDFGERHAYPASLLVRCLTRRLPPPVSMPILASPKDVPHVVAQHDTHRARILRQAGATTWASVHDWVEDLLAQATWLAGTLEQAGVEGTLPADLDDGCWQASRCRWYAAQGSASRGRCPGTGSLEPCDGGREVRAWLGARGGDPGDDRYSLFRSLLEHCRADSGWPALSREVIARALFPDAAVIERVLLDESRGGAGRHDSARVVRPHSRARPDRDKPATWNYAALGPGIARFGLRLGGSGARRLAGKFAKGEVASGPSMLSVALEVVGAKAGPAHAKLRIVARQSASGRGPDLQAIVDALSRERQRASYNAVAALLGVLPQFVMRGRDHNQADAFVVSSVTGTPTGYKEPDLPPDLEIKPWVIGSPEELRSFLREKAPEALGPDDAPPPAEDGSRGGAEDWPPVLDDRAWMRVGVARGRHEEDVVPLAAPVPIGPRVPASIAVAPRDFPRLVIEVAVPPGGHVNLTDDVPAELREFFSQPPRRVGRPAEGERPTYLRTLRTEGLLSYLGRALQEHLVQTLRGARSMGSSQLAEQLGVTHSSSGFQRVVRRTGGPLGGNRD